MRIIFILLFLNISFNLISSPLNFNNYFIESARVGRKSVVNIEIFKKIYKKRGFFFKRIANASGTIISSDGYIITNFHVVNKGNYYKIIDNNGIVYDTEKLNRNVYYFADIKTDLAILKIKNNNRKKFKPIKFANSNKLQAGEWVIAIGNPFGLKQSITAGIVSSKGRDSIGFSDIEDFIQSDVSINPGNSGGPLLDLYGNLVGINTAIKTSTGGYQGISFSIPSNIVKRVYLDLMRYGRVRRGWLGFIVKEREGRDGINEIKIISISKKSPAYKIGLRKGDIVVSINDRKISSLGSIVKIVSNKSIGSFMKIKFLRNGKIYIVKVVLREKKVYREIQKSLKLIFALYGFELDENASANKIFVTYKTPRSLKDLKQGDEIISINGIEVYTLEKFIKIFNKNRREINFIEIKRNNSFYKINFK